MAKSAMKPKPTGKKGGTNGQRRNGKAWKLRACGERHAPDYMCVTCPKPASKARK